MADHLSEEQHFFREYTEIEFQFIFNKTKFHEHIEVLDVKLSPSDRWEASHA